MVEVRVRAGVWAELDEGLADAPLGPGLPVLIAEAARGGQGGALQVGVLMPAAGAAQVRPHRVRELHGMNVKADTHRLGCHRTQHVVLSREPRHRPGIGVKAFWYDAGLGRAGPEGPGRLIDE